MIRHRLPWAFLATLLVAGCVGADRGPPPTTTLEGRRCIGETDVVGGNVRPLSIGAPLTVTVDETAACWSSPTGNSAYVAFKLPETAAPFVIKVLSEPLGQTIFTPRLILRDAEGQVRREIPRDVFLSRDAALHVAIRVRPDERYLIVASEPSTAGRQATHVSARTQAIPVIVGRAVVFVHTGSDKAATYTYAHNGKVTVTLEPLPTITR